MTYIVLEFLIGRLFLFLQRVHLYVSKYLLAMLFFINNNE